MDFGLPECAKSRFALSSQPRHVESFNVKSESNTSLIIVLRYSIVSRVVVNGRGRCGRVYHSTTVVGSTALRLWRSDWREDVSNVLQSHDHCHGQVVLPWQLPNLALKGSPQKQILVWRHLL